MYPVPQDPVTRFFFARLRSGFGGEAQRVVHVFREPDQGQSAPSVLTSMCQAVFAPHELEVMGEPRGMPCEACLAITPFSAVMI
jgi:hypothetical protein